MNEIEKIISSLVSSMTRLNKKVDLLSQHDSVSVSTRTENGDLPTGYTGQVVINTHDGTIKIYDNGVWRLISNITVSPTEPTKPFPGLIWIDNSIP